MEYFKFYTHGDYIGIVIGIRIEATIKYNLFIYDKFGNVLNYMRYGNKKPDEKGVIEFIRDNYDEWV